MNDSPAKQNSDFFIPLAQFLRPDKLEDFVGQGHLVKKNKILYNAILSDKIQSYLFWGPPGSGKTTLANIIARTTNSKIIMLNSVNASTKSLKEIFETAEYEKKNNIKTILFIDEIHRFNKNQQDLFLPYVETGTIYLISATTENPSFEINSQLLSRLKVLKLYPLTVDDIEKILRNAVLKKNEWNHLLADIEVSEDCIDILKNSVNGDGRQALNILETSFINAIAQNTKIISKTELSDAMQTVFMNYDKTGEEHYNIISALHKSLRGSDVNASIYWCVRMLESGEDPLYLARRLIRMSSEDIGVADTNAMTVALNAYNVYKMLGSPEGELAIIEAVIYLASAPKSNSVYMAYNSAKKFIAEDGYRSVPLHICNAPTKMMKQMGYSNNYKYPFDYKYNFVDENYFPEGISNSRFYSPSNFGFEKEIIKRIEFWENLKNKK
ncbi:replication-associated recombination protein A [Candidatus Dependentiae bacterium]|nr:replication-associated recombination protein A [Candidatus Dependentiae bacterium]